MSTSTQAQSPAPAQGTKVDDAVAVAETIMRFIADGVSGFGVKGLDAAAKMVLGIIVHYKRIRDNSALCKDVAEELSALTTMLKSTNDIVRTHFMAQAQPTTPAPAAAQLGSPAELTNRIDRLEGRLNDINAMAAKLQSQGKFLRTMMANRNADILREMRDHMRRARQEFQLEGQLAVEINLAHIAAGAEENFARQREAELEAALAKLPNAEASYRASVHARHGHLLKGTREALLTELKEWAAAETDIQREHPFYILSGGAGTGKSTIAYELARRADKDERLGASFFFMRGSALLSTTEVFFPTLARQLIRNVPAVRENALALIQDHLKHGARQNLDLQAKDLFAGLLSQLPPDHPPVVIVIDAVDECTDSAQDLVCHMLYLMKDALSHISFPLRVFVTSRPEAYIEDAFHTRFGSAQKFVLHKIPAPVINADIRLYFNSALAELPDGPRNSLTLLYPDASDDLTDRAAGLFIYATTAVEYLKQYRSAITEGMGRLLATARGEGKTALQKLDDLYILVLQSAFPREYLRDKRDSIRAFLGRVAVLQDHISPDDLATLTGVSYEYNIRPVLERLGAVLCFELGNPHAPMRPLHASFGEFLVDATRCTDPDFHVNLAEHHLAVANSCLTLLMGRGALVHNVCRLPDPSIPRDEIDDLSARVAKYLPAPVQYSCKHWFVHLALSGGDRGTTPQLLGFCRRRPLEWIEAVVFLDSVDRVLIWLPILHRLYSQSAPGFSQEARQLLFEIWRFVLEFSPAIKTCPQQIYLSSLPLLPASSKLLETINTRPAGSPAFSCSHGIVPEWPVWYDIQPSTLRGMGTTDIECAVLERSGRWIAVAGSNDIHLCHVETGDVFLSVRAHDDSVRHLSVSANGLRLVSTSLDRVCVNSTRSGAVVYQLDGPPGQRRHFLSGDFIINDTVILIHLAVDDSEALQIWDPKTDTVRELPVPAPTSDRLELVSDIAISSTGRWAIAVFDDGPTGTATTSYLGHFFDLLSGTVAYTLQLSATGVCFLSDDTAFVPVVGAILLVKMPIQEVLAVVPCNSDHFRLVASLDAAMVIGVRVPYATAPQHVIDVWHFAGGAKCVPAGCFLQCAFLRTGGGGLLAVTGSSWRMLDVERATALTSSAPPGSARVIDTYDDADDDSSETESLAAVVAISHDCSHLAFVLNGTLRILDAGGTAVASVAVDMRPLKPKWGLFVRLAFGHERRLVATITVRDICLYNIVDGTTLGRYGIPDDAIRELSHETRLRHLGIGADVKHIEFLFRHATFTPDDTAIVAIMLAQPATTGLTPIDSFAQHRLYTVRWDLRCPCPCRISVLTTDVSLMPWRTIFHGHKSLQEVDIDQNWNLRVYIGGTGVPQLVYTIPRSDWDREDRGENVVTSEGSLDPSLYLATDGWIMDTLSKQRIGWLPTSRRPDLGYYLSRTAFRGRLGATLSNSGLLTILNMSERT